MWVWCGVVWCGVAWRGVVQCEGGQRAPSLGSLAEMQNKGRWGKIILRTGCRAKEKCVQKGVTQGRETDRRTERERGFAMNRIINEKWLIKDKETERVQGA